MKTILFTSVLAILVVTSYAFYISNNQFANKTYAVEVCRAKAMATYESAWDNCCYKSGQSVSCKAQLNCEPNWDKYASQMKSCFK